MGLRGELGSCGLFSYWPSLVVRLRMGASVSSGDFSCGDCTPGKFNGNIRKESAKHNMSLNDTL